MAFRFFVIFPEVKGIKTYLFWLQLLGAIGGVIVIFLMAIAVPVFTGPLILILFLSLFFSLFSLYAAWTIKAYGGLNYSIKPTLINQAFNLFGFSVAGFKMVAMAQPSLAIGWHEYFGREGVFWKFNVASFHFGIDSDNSQEMFFSINVIALVNVFLIALFLLSGQKPGTSNE